MISALWNTVFYEPLYNILVFLIGGVPWGDVGLAVIILTLLVKFALFPLSQKAVRSQIKLKELNPELEKIKKTYAGNKEEQARQTFELYKKANVNPFSSCLLLLVQLPVIFALYQVFFRGLDFGTEHLYSFIRVPETFSTMFLGLIDMHGKSIVLALLAGATQFIQAKLNAPLSAPSSGDEQSFQTQFAQSMQMQMKYVLPVFVAIFAYQISAAVALYWTASNLFMVGQEIYMRHKLAREKAGSLKGVTVHDV